MDRELSKSVIRKRNRKRILQYSLAFVGVIGSVLWALGKSESKVMLQSYMIGTAHKTDLHIGFEAYGTIEAFYNELISSPISANVERIHFLPGDTISPSDTIISFELEELKAEINKLEKEVQIKQFEILKLEEQVTQEKLNNKSVETQDSINISQLKTSYERNKYLFEIGGGPKVQMETALMNLRLAQIKNEQAQKNNASKSKNADYQIQILRLQYEIQKDELNKLKQSLNASYISPKNKGVLRNINVQPGQSISKGSELAMLSGVHQFKIKGSVPTKYSNRLRIGQTVKFKYGEKAYSAILISFATNKQNNGVDFQLRILNNNDKANFISGIKLPLRFIESSKVNQLCIPDGGIYKSAGTKKIFVLEKNYLQLRKVEFGGYSEDAIEIISGLKEGDKVIVNNSFYKEHEGKKRIKYEIVTAKY